MFPYLRPDLSRSILLFSALQKPVDGELNFAVGQTPAYTTVTSWTNGTLVYFKVQAQKGSEEKTNSVTKSSTADTVGPVVSDPAIVVEVM